MTLEQTLPAYVTTELESVSPCSATSSPQVKSESSAFFGGDLSGEPGAMSPSSSPLKKGPRKSSNLLDPADKRANHNAIERARRETLNGRFMVLAEALPSMANVKRPSKSVIVNKALDFVCDARIRESALTRENNKLRAEVDQLRARLGMAPLPLPTPIEVLVENEKRNFNYAANPATSAECGSAGAMPAAAHAVANSHTPIAPAPLSAPEVMQTPSMGDHKPMNGNAGQMDLGLLGPQFGAAQQQADLTMMLQQQIATAAAAQIQMFQQQHGNPSAQQQAIQQQAALAIIQAQMLMNGNRRAPMGNVNTMGNMGSSTMGAAGSDTSSNTSFSPQSANMDDFAAATVSASDAMFHRQNEQAHMKQDYGLGWLHFHNTSSHPHHATPKNLNGISNNNTGELGAFDMFGHDDFITTG